MRRYVFALAIGEDRKSAVVPMMPPPFDKNELVQPDSAPLYPDAPEDQVLVGFGVDALDRSAANLAEAERLVAEGPATVAEVDAYNFAVMHIEDIRADHAAFLAALEPGMEAASLELQDAGFAYMGVSDVL